jgi:hypothetical protein
MIKANYRMQVYGTSHDAGMLLAYPIYATLMTLHTPKRRFNRHRIFFC